MSQRRRHGLNRACWLLIPAALLACGCSGAEGGRRQVSGEITLDGEPLPGGWIYFRPQAEGHSSAGEITAGNFNIPAKQGLVAGTYTVAIEYRQPTGRMQKVYTGEEIEEVKQIVPPQYNEATTLSATIEPSGKNELKFELTSE